MALLKFYVDTGNDFDIDTSGSGLGFFGSGGFGRSVAVGAYQENTYVTDGNGATQGPSVNNVKYVHANSGELDGSTTLNLQHIPNWRSTLNVRFTHTSAVQVQNAEVCIYDRTSLGSGAVGVTTWLAEILHPSVVESGSLGSGDTSWEQAEGTGSAKAMADSPGISGLYALNGTGSVHSGQIHDWYLCLSASPDTIGAKTQYGLYFSLEYL